jgi:hypothetical protein
MRTLQIAQFAKARVWINERSTQGFANDGVLEVLAHPSVGTSNRSIIVAVETMLPRGPRAEYGLIGCQFTPDDRGSVRLVIPYSGMGGVTWIDSLAVDIDDVRLGLPREYTSSVADSLVSGVEGRMSSGILRITDAAHGLVGSSPNVLGRLAKAVVEVALLGGADVPDDQMVTLLRELLIG